MTGAGTRARWQARVMQAADVDRVWEIERDVYPHPWTRGNFADSLAAGYDAWVFEDGDEMLGYAILMWLPDEAHLLNLAVRRTRQRQGFGRAFLEWLCTRAHAHGSCSLLLEVRPSNLGALLLYESSGFARIGLRRGYYPAADGAREDALVLVRRLDAVAAAGARR